jgi:hypothetical protein
MEQRVREKLPRDVKSLLAQFDLSSLEFGELVFGVPGRAIYLQNLNLEDYSPYPWWGKGPLHPKGVLAVAIDPEGVVILDCSDGKILYFDGNSSELFPISQNLEEFILLCANFLWDEASSNEASSTELSTQIKKPTIGAKFWRMYGVEVESS